MLRSPLKICLLVILSLIVSRLCAYPGLIDTPRYSVSHLTDENGLPQNTVRSIAKDNHGFIWLTTEDGVVRFDGRRFVVFTTGNTNITSSRFSHIISSPGDSVLYTMNSSKEWVRLQDGRVVLDSSFLIKKNAETSYFKNAFGLDVREAGGTLEAAIRGEDSNVKLLVPVAGEKFFLCSRDKVSFYENKKRISDFIFQNNNVWNFFVIDSQLYYLGADKILTGFSATAFNRYAITGDILFDPAFKKNKVEVYWDYSSRSVLFYLKGCYYTVKRTTNGNLQTTLIVSGFNAEDNKIVVGCYDEANATLFLGSLTKGLFIVKKKEFNVLAGKQNYPDDVFYSQTVYKEKNILAAQGFLFHPDGTFTTIPNLGKITKQDKYAMLTDKQGFVWLKNEQYLYQLEPGHLSIVKQWELPDGIATLKEGIDGELWIGLREKGLYRFDITKENTIPQFVMDFPDITCIKQQSRDKIWLASIRGLYKVDINTKKKDTVTGLLGMYVRSIYDSGDGNLWLTTYGNGFFLYAKDKLVKFPVDKDNFLATAHCIVEDRNGFFWITTNKGLFQAAKKDLLSYARKEQPELYYYYYERGNGFNTNEFNGGCDPCGIKLSDGKISFPSLNGLVIFDPAGIKPILPDKDIFIDKLQLDNVAIPFTGAIHLPRNFKQLQLSVSSPFFGNKKNISFTYALTKNGDRPLWVPLADDGIVSFSTMPAGTYTLTLRKLNGFGKSNYTQKIVTFYIPAAWYQTTWFLAGTMLLAVLLTLLFAGVRNGYMIRKNQMLEQRIAERTEKLQQTLNYLENTQNDLQQKAYLQEYLIAAISHDIKTPIKYLMLTSQKMHEGLAHENKSVYTGTSEVVKNYISRLYDSVHNLVQYTKAQKDKNYIATETFPLHEFVADKINFFTEPARQQHTLFKNNVPPDLNVTGSKQVLSIILRNLLDNAVKNTSNGTIAINAGKNADIVEIVITDTGYGMQKEMVKWINNEKTTDRLNENKVAFSANSGGLGLVIVKELSALIQIKLFAESVQGIGSSVHLFLKEESPS
jgi:signal transduction histidine kinase